MKIMRRKRYLASSKFLRNAYSDYLEKVKEMEKEEDGKEKKISSITDICTKINKKSFLTVETQKNYLNGYSRPQEEKDIDFLSSFLDFDKNALLLAYSNDTGDENTLIDDIKTNFFDMDDFNCYKLTEYFVYYKKISYSEWPLVYNFSLLNDSDKKEVINRIINIEIKRSLKFILKVFKDVQLLEQMRCYSEFDIKTKYEQFLKSNTKNKENSNDCIKEKLWNKFKKDLKGLHVDYLSLLLEQMIDITTMDYKDWTLIICYYQYKSPLMKRGGQNTNFLHIIYEFLQKEEYLSISDKIIR